MIVAKKGAATVKLQFSRCVNFDPTKKLKAVSDHCAIDNFVVPGAGLEPAQTFRSEGF